jgi:hypothetical protein
MYTPPSIAIRRFPILMWLAMAAVSGPPHHQIQSGLPSDCGAAGCFITSLYECSHGTFIAWFDKGVDQRYLGCLEQFFGSQHNN